MKSLTVRFCPELAGFSKEDRSLALKVASAELSRTNPIRAQAPMLFMLLGAGIGFFCEVLVPSSHPKFSDAFMIERMLIGVLFPGLGAIPFFLIGYVYFLRALRPLIQRQIQDAILRAQNREEKE